MKKMKCSDMGMECKFEVQGKTPGELKKKMLKHAERAHKTVLNDATPAQMDEMVAQLDRLAKSA